MFPIEFLLLIRVFSFIQLLVYFKVYITILVCWFFLYSFSHFFSFPLWLYIIAWPPPLRLSFRPTVSFRSLSLSLYSFFLHKNDSSFCSGVLRFFLFVVTCSGTDTFCFVCFVSKTVRCCLLVLGCLCVCQCVYVCV